MTFNKLYPKFPFSLPMLLDGATGTELFKAGMPSGICPEQWILENPKAIQDIQTRYFHAGSDAVLAPTFGANRAVLSRYGFADQTAEMNRALAALSREIAGEKLVAGDISPCGKLLSPIGDATLDELISIYKEQASALEDHVDFYMLETNMDLSSARAAVLGVKAVSKKPIFVTMTVTESGKTMYGDTPECALLTLSELGITAFGLNCSTGPREMKALLAPIFTLSVSLGIPMIAKPNAGAPTKSGEHEHLDAKFFADIGAEMLSNGISILGGCCGTDSTTIEKLHTMMTAFSDEIEKPNPMPTKNIACTTREYTEIPADNMPEPISVDDDLLENAEKMADDYDFLYLRLQTQEDVETVLESVPFFSSPLAVCGKKEILDILIKNYCGKIVVIQDNV